MRVELITCLCETPLHGLCNLLVGISGTTDVLANGFVALAIEVEDASEVAWVAHIHRIGNGLLAWLWLITACLQVVVEDVVGIVGCYETADR